MDLQKEKERYKRKILAQMEKERLELIEQEERKRMEMQKEFEDFLNHVKEKIPEELYKFAKFPDQFNCNYKKNLFITIDIPGILPIRVEYTNKDGKYSENIHVKCFRNSIFVKNYAEALAIAEINYKNEKKIKKRE